MKQALWRVGGPLLIALLAAARLPAAQADKASFSTADTAIKRQTLDDIATQRNTGTGSPIADILRAGLQDRDAALRQRALLAVASRAGGPRFMNNEQTTALWRTDRTPIQGLRPLVLAALRDRDEGVRHAAVLALGNMDYDLNDPSPSPALSAPVLDALVAAYNSDTSGRVRGEIVKGFALSSNDSRELRDIVGKALDDAEAAPRQYAVVAAGRLGGSEYLDKLVLLLQHDDHATVRGACARAIASYGSSAANYLDVLTALRDHERDATVNSLLAHTIAHIRSRK